MTYTGKKGGEEKSIREDILSYRKDIIKLCVMAIPTALVTMGVNWIKDNIFSQPWQAILIILPLGVTAYFLFKKIHHIKEFKIKGFFLWFFLVYILIFTIAAGTKILDWQLSPAGYNNSIPGNWLSLNWAGDWRYYLIPEEPLKKQFVVILKDSPENKSIEGMRYDLIKLIKIAAREKAKGIALDFYLLKNSMIDSLLCSSIEEVEKNNLKVFAGYNFKETHGEFVRNFIAGNLQACFPPGNQGHLLGFAELDNKVRYVPLFFKGDTSFPALSYQFAKSISAIKVPDNGLLQFVRPSEGLKTVPFEELQQSKDWSILRDKYILAGESSARDSFETPYGKIPGVLIHAYAVHSLLQNQYIRHATIWISLVIVFSFCFLLTFLSSQGMPLRKLLQLNIIISLITVAVSALLIYFWLIWLDIIYPLTAVWLYLPLLTALRKIDRKKL